MVVRRVAGHINLRLVGPAPQHLLHGHRGGATQQSQNNSQRERVKNKRPLKHLITQHKTSSVKEDCRRSTSTCVKICVSPNHPCPGWLREAETRLGTPITVAPVILNGAPRRCVPNPIPCRG